MDSRHVVALFTHGTFTAWCTDPVTLQEAVEFIDDPPESWSLRPQDRFVVFELGEPEEPE